VKRIIFEFEPNGDNGIYEMEEVRRHLKSLDLCLCLYDITNKMRQTIDSCDEDQYALLEKIQDMIYESMDYHGIDLDELIS